MDKSRKSLQDQIQSLASNNSFLSKRVKSLQWKKDKALDALDQSNKEITKLRATIKKYQVKGKLFAALESENRTLKKQSKSCLVSQPLPEETPGTSSDAETIENLRIKIIKLEKVNNKLSSEHQKRLSDIIGLRERVAELQNQLIAKTPGQFTSSSQDNPSTERQILKKSLEVKVNYTRVSLSEFR